MEQDANWKGIILVAAVACAVYCFTDVAQPPKPRTTSESTNCGGVEASPAKPNHKDASEATPNCESDESEATPHCKSDSEPDESDHEADEWLEVSEVETPEVNTPDAHIKN